MGIVIQGINSEETKQKTKFNESSSHSLSTNQYLITQSLANELMMQPDYHYEKRYVSHSKLVSFLSKYKQRTT